MCNIFMNNHDFERTENSDYIHGVIGRALIIATRFESLCKAYADRYEYIIPISIASIMEDDILFQKIIDRMNKFQNLNQSINKVIKKETSISHILHKARKSRNDIVHSLTKSLDGCADLRIKNKDFIENVTELISNIADGDIIISTLISISNKDPSLLHYLKNQKEYKKNMIRWVIEK